MTNYFATKDINKVFVDDVEFKTINSIKIFLKNDKVYLKIYNEVLDKYTFGKFINNIQELISNKKEHSVKIVLDFIHCSGEVATEDIDVECIIPDNVLLEINPTEINDLGFLFEIVDIPENEFTKQFKFVNKMKKSREQYKAKYGC